MELIDKTYKFDLSSANSPKFEILLEKAKNLLVFRNEISQKVCTNSQFYITKSKFDWVTHFRKKIELCNNQDVTHAIIEVYKNYANKKAAYKKATTVKIQDKMNTILYKKNGKNFKKGDTRIFDVVMKSTKMTMIVSYLSKYMNDGLLEFLRTSKSDDKDKQDFRDMVLGYVDGKHGDRILVLAKSKQERIIKKIFEHAIEFESLTFVSCTEQKQNIITKNKNTQSIYNAFITIPGQPVEDGKITIPTKLSKKHHGQIGHYYKDANKKDQRNTTYTIIFNDKKGIEIALTRKKADETVIGKTNYYGVDVNVKHNLFCDKHGHEIDYDRDIFNDYVKFLRYCDRKLNAKAKKNGEKRKGIKLSNKDAFLKKTWEIRVKDMLKRKSNKLVIRVIELGMDHIVLEDLSLMGRGYSKSLEFEGFKYSRLIRLLNIASLKAIIQSIGNKHGLQVTFVHASYTSQTCTCGCVDKRNRKIQEIFKCIVCGLEAYADAHAGDLIEDRMSDDVLRSKLMNCKNGVYTPKKLKRKTIKEILIACYDTNTSTKNQDVIK